jgi:hypothetical protein
METNKAIGAFIIDEVLPVEKDPWSRMVLGGLAGATALFKIEALDGMDPAMVESIVRGAFKAQETFELRLADLLTEGAWAMYPILRVPQIKKALEAPYKIDAESAEKFLALLKQ